LLATPIAVWAQGLPASSIVGADFGVRHWIANDLVIVGLVFGSFAAVIELSGLDLQRRRSTVLLRLAATLAARVEPPREPGPASATSTPSASEPRDQGA
jgi:hypothetical protein